MMTDDRTVAIDVDRSTLGPDGNLVTHRHDGDAMLAPATLGIECLAFSQARLKVGLILGLLPHEWQRVVIQAFSVDQRDSLLSSRGRRIEILLAYNVWILASGVSNLLHHGFDQVTASNLSWSTHHCTIGSVGNAEMTFNKGILIKLICLNSGMDQSHVAEETEISGATTGHEHVHPQRAQLAVVVMGHGILAEDFFASTNKRHVNVAVQCQANGATSTLTSQSCQSRYPCRMYMFATKATTAATMNETDTICGNTKHVGDSSVHGIRPLTACIHHHVVVFFRDCVRNQWLHVKVRLGADLHLEAVLVLGSTESLVGFFGISNCVHRTGDVQFLTGLGGLASRDHQRFCVREVVFDVHQLGSLLGETSGSSHHDGNRQTLSTHLVGDQGLERPRHRRDVVLALDVLVSDHGQHSVQSERARGIHAHQLAVRNGRGDQRSELSAFLQRNVISVLRTAGGLGTRTQLRNGLADRGMLGLIVLEGLATAGETTRKHVRTRTHLRWCILTAQLEEEAVEKAANQATAIVGFGTSRVQLLLNDLQGLRKGGTIRDLRTNENLLRIGGTNRMGAGHIVRHHTTKGETSIGDGVVVSLETNIHAGVDKRMGVHTAQSRLVGVVLCTGDDERNADRLDELTTVHGRLGQETLHGLLTLAGSTDPHHRRVGTQQSGAEIAEEAQTLGHDQVAGHSTRVAHVHVGNANHTFDDRREVGTLRRRVVVLVQLVQQLCERAGATHRNVLGVRRDRTQLRHTMNVDTQLSSLLFFVDTNAGVARHSTCTLRLGESFEGTGQVYRTNPGHAIGGEANLGRRVRCLEKLGDAWVQLWVIGARLGKAGTTSNLLDIDIDSKALGSVQNRTIAGATAEVTVELLFHTSLLDLGVLTQRSVRRHHHTRRAEATLGTVKVGDALLNRMQITVRLAETFSCGHRPPIDAGQWSQA
mmetsp:Transcript_2679/g.6468  ORF Transcript_2679/g.6468 Transcript_2679/m.6468 type:complete len:934 (-) Transcript_2679:616-3417(-)